MRTGNVTFTRLELLRKMASAVKAAVLLPLICAASASPQAPRGAAFRLRAPSLPSYAAPPVGLLRPGTLSPAALPAAPLFLSAELFSAQAPAAPVPQAAEYAAGARELLIAAQGRVAAPGVSEKTASLPALSRTFDGASEIRSRGLVAAGRHAPSKSALTPPTENPASKRPAADVPAARTRETGPERQPLFLKLYERAKLLLWRALAFPAHVWPVSRIARLLAHGEPFTGLTPESAIKAAVDNSKRGIATVLGRLAPGLRDEWSVRGAEKSFARLLLLAQEARRKNPGLAAAVALDAAYFGSELAGLPEETRRERAASAMLRLARQARALKIAVEIDVTGEDDLPMIAHIAERIVREANMPVRLAIAARHEASGDILTRWIALAEETGIRSGVRLVKGSYVEDKPGTINLRRPLLEHYKKLIAVALDNSGLIDVAVATHNLEIFDFARERAARTAARFRAHVIKGVNPSVQLAMRREGKLAAEYVSYGLDAPHFGLLELYSNWKARRALVRRGSPRELLD